MYAVSRKMSLQLIIFSCVLAVALSTEREFYGVGLGYFGGRVKENEFPHLISLQEGSGASIRHRCGGSLINNAWVLTAAHCLVDADPNLMVKVGKYHFQNYAGPSERTYNVIKKITHEKYLPGQVSPHDIALLKLEKLVSFNDYVQPISLPNSTNTIILDGTPVTVAGWGTLFSREIGQKFESYKTLQKMTTQVINLERCRSTVKTITREIAPIEESNICTGPMEGGEAACIGDPGGPLIRYYKNEENKTKSELVGIVSWGVTPCGTPGAPSIYTKILDYVDWIQDKISNN